MSKSITLIHLVFCTKSRLATINPETSVNLYRVIHEKLNEQNCYLYRINSMPNHVHLLFNLSPRVALADVVKELKSKSSQWMTKSGLHPVFKGWGKGYFSASVSPQNKDSVINYIKINRNIIKTNRLRMRFYGSINKQDFNGTMTI